MTPSDLITHPLTVPVLIGVLLAITTLLFALQIRLMIRFRRVLRGKDGKDLEDTITTLHERLLLLEKKGALTENKLLHAEKKLHRSLAHASTVRFNAFEGTGEGGNQSFATAIVSHEGNGVVFSSIATRDRMRVYAKPLNTFASPYELSEEERLAITDAEKTLTKKTI